MRLAGRAKGGFFPCPPDAIAFIADYLRPPEGDFCLVDPCAGKGAAVKQLAEALGCKPENVFVIELDESRAVECKAALPNSRVLAPASFLGVASTQNSFSLAYVNAPFDSELGHSGRVEYTFLQRATAWLRPGGVIALVCPEHVAERHDVTQYLCQWFSDIALLPFPENCREYQEVVVFGHKRPKPVDAAKLAWQEVCQRDIEPGHYPVPPGNPPKRFEKVELTEPELARALLGSPLRKRLQPPGELPLSEPPLPLSQGHIALLLASGKLDGAVYPKNEPAHVVRGTARKEQYLSGQTEEEANDGARVSKTTYSEKIVLTIRAVGPDGSICTFE